MSEQDTDIMSVLQKMQQQLTYLEKKIDTILQQQSQPKPFDRGPRNFSKPFRPYGRPSGQGHRPEYGNRPDQGNRPSHGPRPNHADRPREGNFAPKKKPFFGRGRTHS